MTNKKKGLSYVGLVLYGTLVMLLCTKSSPVYVLNDWYDANAYFTMGKGLINGAVPYKDLFDHKGPFLYLLYGIGYLLDHTGFLGIFLLQVASIAIVLSCAFKIALLYNLTERVAFLAATIVPLVMLSEGFYTYKNDYGGGGPDEFILPIFSMILYLVIKLIKKENLFSKMHIYMFIIGVLSSLIFQLKFTYLSLVIGLLLPSFICLFVDNFMIFIKSLINFVLGFLAGTIPYLIYSLGTKSLGNFFKSYIIFNKTYGSKSGGNSLYLIAIGLKNLTGVFLGRNMLICFFILIGLIYFLFVYRGQVVLNLSILLSFIMGSVTLSIIPFLYNFIIFGVFFIFAFIALCDIINRTHWKIQMESSCSKLSDFVIKATSISLVFFVTVANNGLVALDSNKLTHTNVQESCQQKIANVILRDTEQDYSLLEVLSQDSGFYTKLGIVPRSKFFYKPNITFNKCPVIYRSQYNDIIKKINKYVISDFEVTLDESEYDKEEISSINYKQKIQQAIAENYDQVLVVDGTNLQKNKKFYLYKRIDSEYLDNAL